MVCSLGCYVTSKKGTANWPYVGSSPSGSSKTSHTQAGQHKDKGSEYDNREAYGLL